MDFFVQGVNVLKILVTAIGERRKEDKIYKNFIVKEVKKI